MNFNPPPSIQQVERGIEGMVEDVQKNTLIPLQKESFLCCAQCCDAARTARDLETCVMGCSSKSMQAQKVIQSQLRDFQERFQREAMRCQDSAKDAVGIGMDPSPSQHAMYMDKFNGCMESVGAEFLQRIPKLKSDIEAALRRY